MKFILGFFMLMPGFAFADNQTTVNECIQAWKTSPFAKGTAPDIVTGTGVKVFGLGSSIDDLKATSKPSLVLVRPSVNVLGKSKIRLLNPNGWYCFKSNVSVLGKVEIELECKGHIASAQDGATVLAADDSDKGVTVLGSLRVTRLHCEK